MNSRRRSRWRVSIGLCAIVLSACGSDSSSFTALPQDAVVSGDAVSRSSSQTQPHHNQASVSALFDLNDALSLEDAAQILAIYNLPPDEATRPLVASVASILLSAGDATVPVTELPSLLNADVAQPAGVLDLADVAVVVSTLQTTSENRNEATIANLATELIDNGSAGLQEEDVRVVPGEEALGADGQPGGRAVAVGSQTAVTDELVRAVNELPVSIAIAESPRFPPGTTLDLPRPPDRDRALRVSYRPPLMGTRTDEIAVLDFTAAELGCTGLACALGNVDVIPEGFRPAPGDYELTYEFRTQDGSGSTVIDAVRRVLTVRDAGIDFIPPLPVQLSTALPFGTLAGDVEIEVDGTSGSEPFSVRGQNGAATFALAPDQDLESTRYVVNAVADATVNLARVTRFSVFGLENGACVSVRSLLSDEKPTIAVGDFCPNQPPPPPPPAIATLTTPLASQTLAGDMAIEVDANELVTETFAIVGTNGTALFEKSPEQEFGTTRYVVANVESATVNLGGVTQFDLPGTAGLCVTVTSLIDSSDPTLAVTAPCPNQPPTPPPAATVTLSTALGETVLAGDVAIAVEIDGLVTESFEVVGANGTALFEKSPEQEFGTTRYVVANVESATVNLGGVTQFGLPGTAGACVTVTSLIDSSNPTLAVAQPCPNQPPPPPAAATVTLSPALPRTPEPTLAGDVRIEVQGAGVLAETFAIAGSNGTATFERSESLSGPGLDVFLVADVGSALVNLSGVSQFGLPGSGGRCTQVRAITVDGQPVLSSTSSCN